MEDGSGDGGGVVGEWVGGIVASNRKERLSCVTRGVSGNLRGMWSQVLISTSSSR